MAATTWAGSAASSSHWRYRIFSRGPQLRRPSAVGGWARGCGATRGSLAAGESGLKNMGNGNYQFNWKTPTSYVGSCESIELAFGAGGLSYTDGPFAFFSFTK